MRSKFKTKNQDLKGPNRSYYSSTELSPSHQPVQSPSPDKKASNIITSTRSPEINELKQFQDKQRMVSSWYGQQEHPLEKPFPMNTPSKTDNHPTILKIEETQPTSQPESDPRLFSPTSNSRCRNTRIQIVAESTPEQFDPRTHLSRIRELNHSDSKQLDYLKLLRSKQETIKELKEIIEMIKRGNTSQDELDQGYQVREFKERIGELNAEVRELKIENQHLLNVIEKNKKNNSRTPVREDILQREIRELKATIEEKELELQERDNDNPQLQLLRQQLQKSENENAALLRILKEKEETLGNSSLSVQSRSSEKEKLTLTKIKEQHQQNLKLAKQNFYGQLEKIETAYHSQLQQLVVKLEEMEEKVAGVEMLRKKISQKIPQEQVQSEVREEYHKEKQRHQEIESLMLEKYSKYENQLLQLKKTNERLIGELAKANKSIQEVGNKNRNPEKENHISELQGLLGREREANSALAAQLNQLHQDHQNLQRLLQRVKIEKEEAVSQLEKKIELILLEYETHSKQEKEKYELALTQLESQLHRSDSKSKELVDTYERDKQDTELKITQAIELYNKENEALKSKLNQKNHECSQLLNQLEHFKKEHSRKVDQDQLEVIAKECEDLRVRCQNLEKEISNLNEELVQMDDNLKEKDQYILTLQAKTDHLQSQKQAISKKHSQSEIKNNDLTVRSSQKELEVIEIQGKVQQLEKMIEVNQEKSTLRIRSLEQEVETLQNQNKTLVVKTTDLNQEIEIKNNVIGRLEGEIKQIQTLKWTQNQPLEAQLEELKGMITDFCTKISPSAEKEIVEEFYKLNYNFETKLEENLKLANSLEQLKNEMLDMKKEKELYEEKINLLEHHNKIYERELKERRTLFDQLLQEKIKVEKEALLVKKIKMEQSQLQHQQKGRIGQIEERIDHLLEMQRLRNQNIMTIVGGDGRSHE